MWSTGMQPMPTIWLPRVNPTYLFLSHAAEFHGSSAVFLCLLGWIKVDRAFRAPTGSFLALKSSENAFVDVASIRHHEARMAGTHAP